MGKFKDVTLFKGKKKGIVHTMNIKFDDIRAVFFPKSFYEKYHYLGSVPYNESGDIFKALEPLVIFMDYKANPWWCPRFILRFLHLFGSDNSIVRVRNRFLHNLEKKITKGYMMWDYKTKWTDYDLRISIAGDEQCHFLTDAIEREFYNQGKRKDLFERIIELDPESKILEGSSISYLEKELDRLEELNNKEND